MSSTFRAVAGSTFAGGLGNPLAGALYGHGDDDLSLKAITPAGGYLYDTATRRTKGRKPKPVTPLPDEEEIARMERLRIARQQRSGRASTVLSEPEYGSVLGAE